MRVVGGNNRGRRLVSFEGRSIRPTSDKVRQSVFNILCAPDAGVFTFRRVLDIFAGTGALGIEALSRGAAQAVFIDSDPASIAVIKKNIGLCGFTNAEVMAKNHESALKTLAAKKERFDLVFIDPPYASALVYAVISGLGGLGLVETGGIIVAETSVRTPLASEEIKSLGATFDLIDERKYGDTLIYFFQRPDDK